MACSLNVVRHWKKLQNLGNLLQHEQASLVCWFACGAHAMSRRDGLWTQCCMLVEKGRFLRASINGSNDLRTSMMMANNVAVSKLSKDISCSKSRSRGFSSASDLPPHQEMGMPSLSPTMTEGNIARWLKKEGDKICPGEVLCEVETDKATIDMECMEEGFLAKIIKGDGSKEVKVGEIIAITVEDEEDVVKMKDFSLTSETSPVSSKESPPPTSSSSPPTQEVLGKSEISQPRSLPADDRILCSPLARKFAQDHNVHLSNVKGTGPGASIQKADVEDYLATQVKEGAAVVGTGEVAADLDYVDLPQSQVRKVTAGRLLASKLSIPHYYLTVDTCVDKLQSLRAQLNTRQQAAETKHISVNDLVIKAAALALRKVPQCNSSWTDAYIRQYRNVNVSVAVQTENGLYVPVIKDADRKGLSEIAGEVKLLAQKARDNSLRPHDYQGGTFTVSNLGGQFGVKQFCAIINPPQSAILAVGSAEKRVVPGDAPQEFKFASFISVTLSCDHRVIDGAMGAEWLKAFKGFIENPETMLL